ncbi:RNA polymerase sigma factor [Anoxybacterium hadale]
MVDAYQFERRFGDSISFLKNFIYNLFFSLVSSEGLGCGKTKQIQDTLRSALINDQAETLMTAYGNNVLRLAYSYLHNMSDAEDVLQDTLIQFLKTQPQFETSEHEKAWFLRVAINTSKNKLNYNSIRKTDELSETLAAGEAEDLAFVWDAVKQLPSKYSEVVHLYYHEGYSTAQVASLLSKKETTVRSLLQRARSRLKEVLKEVYDFEKQI